MGRSRRNSRLRRWRHRLVYWGARLLAGVLGRVPFALAVGLGRGVGRVGYFLARRERLRALDHLTRAYGESLTEKERRQVAREAFANLGNLAVEIVHIPRLTAVKLKRRVRVADEGRFRALQDHLKKKGVLILTAHLGAWEWMVPYAPLAMGVGLIAVAREQSNPYVQAWFERVRMAHGVEVAYRKQAGLRVLRGLREGKAIGILLDQCTKGEGVFVPFFGHPAHTLTAPARLALRTRAEIIPVFLIRENGGRQLALHVLDPVPLPETEDVELAAYQLTACLTSIIEEQVRRWPEQWVWIHRRWRRTPEDDRDPAYDPATGAVIPSRE